MHMIIWNAWKSTYFYADKVPAADFENYRAYATLSIKFLAVSGRVALVYEGR